MFHLVAALVRFLQINRVLLGNNNVEKSKNPLVSEEHQEKKWRTSDVGCVILNSIQ